MTVTAGERHGAWTLGGAPNGGFSLKHDSGLELTACSGASGLPERVQTAVRFGPGPTSNWLTVTLTLTNLTDRPLTLDQVGVFSCGRVVTPAGTPPLDRALCEGRSMTDYSGLRLPGNETFVAEGGVAGFTPKEGGAALVVGFGAFAECFAEVAFGLGSGGVTDLEARCLWENTPLAPEETRSLPPLLLGAGPVGMAALMNEYAAMVAAAMGGAPPRSRAVPAETGWCSWYHYYGTETEADILDNVRTLAATPALRERLRVVQIDDGWNLPHPGHPRVWGDWQAGAKFPRGMRAVADDIRAGGFAPGLWLAPFSVDPASRLRRDHPDWLVRDAATGEPADFWGVHALDLSHPGAQNFVSDTFRRVFDDWGFEYVKIDFLTHAVQPGLRHDPTITTAAAYRRGLSLIREVAGDRFVLCCGAPLGPSVGLCDGMRIGYDVSSRWDVPMNLASWPVGNCSIRAAAAQTLWRQWMHNHWWQNDPDCLVVRDSGTDPEKAMFAELFGGAFASSPPYGLSDEEAALWARLVWMTGGMGLISENVAEVMAGRPDRAALMERALAPNPFPARWVDHYTHPDLCLLRGETSDGTPLLGIFNLSDHPADEVLVSPRALRLAAFSPGRTCRLREIWTGEGGTAVPAGDRLRFPPLPARAGRIWEILA